MELFILLIVLVTIPGLYGFITGIGYVPSSAKAQEEMKRYISFPKHSVIYDLGTGDGKLLFALLKGRKDIRGYGFELFWPVYVVAKIRSFWVPQASVHFQDFYKVDYTKPTHIVCFLHTKPLLRLKEHWESILPSGTIIASCMFRIPGWEDKEIHAGRDKKHVFFYQI